MECRRFQVCVPRVSTEEGQSGELLVMEEAVEECLEDIVVFITEAESAKEVQVRQI